MARRRPRKLSDDIDLEALFLAPEERLATNHGDEAFEALLEDYLGDIPHKSEEGEQRKKRRFCGPVQAELDLHGLTRREALGRVENFCRNSRYQGLGLLRIITGKGIHSGTSPVLKDAVESLLVALKKRGIVKAFRWEKRKKAKSGAILVVV